MSDFSHIDATGGARMVDVSAKAETVRVAVAGGFLSASPETLAALHARALPKGDVLTVAQIAGVQAAKRTSDLVPLCHPLPLSSIHVGFEVEEGGIRIRAEVRVTGRTGAEMEALTAVSVAALTLYDMMKAADPAMVIGDICLLEKEGGKAPYRRAGAA